jgi:hypothetical protein
MNKILIDLCKSNYAHGFSDASQIHQVEIEKAVGLIRSQVNRAKGDEKNGVQLDHIYRTIGVFGDRGSRLY